MTLIPCNVYFPFGWNIICLRWYCIYKRSHTAGLRRKCIAQPSGCIHTHSALTEAMLLNKTHLSETHTRLDYLRQSWRIYEGDLNADVGTDSQPAGRSHYSIFVGLSCQHVNPQREINNRSCIWIGDMKLTAACIIQRGLLYTEPLLSVFIHDYLCKLVQNLLVLKCIQTLLVFLK